MRMSTCRSGGGSVIVVVLAEDVLNLLLDLLHVC